MVRRKTKIITEIHSLWNDMGMGIPKIAHITRLPSEVVEAIIDDYNSELAYIDMDDDRNVIVIEASVSEALESIFSSEVLEMVLETDITDEDIKRATRNYSMTDDQWATNDEDDEYIFGELTEILNNISHVDLLAIRALADARCMTIYELSRKYGISFNTVQSIVERKVLADTSFEKRNGEYEKLFKVKS